MLLTLPQCLFTASKPQRPWVQGRVHPCVSLHVPLVHQILPLLCKRLAGADLVTAAERAVSASADTVTNFCLPDMWLPTLLAAIAAPPCGNVLSACLHSLWCDASICISIPFPDQIWPLQRQSAPPSADEPRTLHNCRCMQGVLRGCATTQNEWPPVIIRSYTPLYN